MEYRRLGSSGLKLSALSLGSWLTFGKQIGNNIAEDLMKLAYDKGVNFFDNAEVYSRGQSEIVMGEILAKMKWSRDSYCVSSKVFFGKNGPADSPPTAKGLSRKHIVEACHQALKRLQVDYLDLYFCHRPDKETPIVETVWAMHNLIQQGKILYWGTSEWSAQEYMEACQAADKYNLIGPQMEQPQYNMLHRDKFEVEYKQLYKNQGMGTTIWSPLCSGVLTGKYNDGFPEDTRLGIDGLEWLKDRTLAEAHIAKVKKLTSLAGELGTTMPKLAIAWCLKNPNVSTVMLGASKVGQLEETLTSFEVVEKLTDDVMVKIEEILGNAPEHPMF